MSTSIRRCPRANELINPLQLDSLVAEESVAGPKHFKCFVKRDIFIIFMLSILHKLHIVVNSSYKGRIKYVHLLILLYVEHRS